MHLLERAGKARGRVPWNEESDLPDEILRSDDASRDSVAKGVQLNCLVRLQVFLSQKDVEVGVLLH